MTGASIVGWREGEAIVLAVHGAFDGASAWALRIRMDEGEATRYVIDLREAEEACEFAACLLSAWARQHGEVALSFRTTSAEQGRLLAAYGLEVEAGEPALALALLEQAAADGPGGAPVAPVGTSGLLAWP